MGEGRNYGKHQVSEGKGAHKREDATRPRKRKMSTSEALAKASHLLRHPPIPIDESSSLTPWVKGLADMVKAVGASSQKRSGKPLCASPAGEAGRPKVNKKGGKDGCNPPPRANLSVNPPVPEGKRAPRYPGSMVKVSEVYRRLGKELRNDKQEGPETARKGVGR